MLKLTELKRLIRLSSACALARAKEARQRQPVALWPERVKSWAARVLWLGEAYLHSFQRRCLRKRRGETRAVSENPARLRRCAARVVAREQREQACTGWCGEV